MKSLLLAGGLLLVPCLPLGRGTGRLTIARSAPFSQAVVAGNTLYVAGQEGPDGGKLEGVSIETQTTNALAAITRAVEKAGFKMTDLVNATAFIADLDDVPKMNEIYKKLMPDPNPRAPR